MRITREQSFMFWGYRECSFSLPTITMKQTLPVTYQQDYSGRESRLLCSQGGRNSPGTSHSWRRPCYPGSWYSGHHGPWNGIVQSQSSIPAIGHCSHRLLAKTFKSDSCSFTNSILKDSKKTKP